MTPAALKQLYRDPQATADYWRRQADVILADDTFRRTLAAELFDHSWITTVRAFLEEGRIAAGARVLEVGCGWGRSAVGLLTLRPGIDYTGVDLVPEFLDRAPAVLAEYVGPCHARFRTADACDLPFEAGTFDAVVTTRVLQYVTDPPAAVAEALRVLKPGGRVVGIVPNRWNPVQRLIYHTRLISPRALRRWLGEAGFTACRSRSLAFLPTRWKRFHWQSRVLALEAACQAVPVLRQLGGLALAAGTKPDGRGGEAAP